MTKFNPDEGAAFCGGGFGFALIFFAALYYLGVLYDMLVGWFGDAVDWTIGVADQIIAYWPF